jgi:ribokinase
MSESRRDTVWDVVVVGGANTDYFMKGPRLPGSGETVQGDMSDEAVGGKGANQAVAVARLGGCTALVGRVGADARGTAIALKLANEGVETSYLHRDPEDVTGLALVLIDDKGAKQIMAVPHANARVGLSDLQGARDALESCRVLLLQLEVPMDIVEEAARIAKKAGALVVLDPSPPRPLSGSLLRRVDVVRPNAREAAAITGIDVHDFQSAGEAARALVGRGAGAAIVEAGDDGNLLLSPEGELRLPLFPVESVDATGAGDAFAGAIAFGLAFDVPWREIGYLASAAAALETTKLGAQAGLPTLPEVIGFLDWRGIELQPDGLRERMETGGLAR